MAVKDLFTVSKDSMQNMLWIDYNSKKQLCFKYANFPTPQELSFTAFESFQQISGFGGSTFSIAEGN